ncbi:MAG: hypothetical protein WC516_04615 [Patescibacteria group bacterium]
MYGEKMSDHQSTDRDYPCPDCGNIEWFHMMDSLADACTQCGYIRVGFPGQWKKGPSLREWAKDIYEANEERRKKNGKH